MSASNLVTRDGFQVVKTDHIIDTVYSILLRVRSLQTRKVYTRWARHPTEDITPADAQRQANDVILQWFAQQTPAETKAVNPHVVIASKKQVPGQRAIKSADLSVSTQVICARVLSDFHGITEETATDIATVYQDIPALLEAYTVIRASDLDESEKIGRMALMLTCVPRTSYGGTGSTFVTPTQSATVWMGLYASQDQRQAWMFHPKNKSKQGQAAKKEAKREPLVASPFFPT